MALAVARGMFRGDGAALALAWVVLIASPAVAQCKNAAVDVCFRPGEESCASRIIGAINGARSSLLVQAYGFTNPQIIQAIAAAHKHGVNVRVVLDKTNKPGRNGKSRYTGATYLRNADVPVRIDDNVAIAHNKVMVIDDELVIGGSYNYTISAETRNAENVTFIRSPCVADVFARNFVSRWMASHNVPAKSP